MVDEVEGCQQQLAKIEESADALREYRPRNLFPKKFEFRHKTVRQLARQKLGHRLTTFVNLITFVNARDSRMFICACVPIFAFTVSHGDQLCVALLDILGRVAPPPLF